MTLLASHADAEVHRRFMSKVDTSAGIDGCWPWLGTRNRHGRGLFVFDARKASRLSVSAPRAAYALYRGDVPREAMVCHRCDNPSCVNPAHLWLGTHADNMRDMVAKCRNADTSGERSGRARLTALQVDEIRRRRLAGERVIDLAREFGVSRANVWQIARGATWKP